MTDIDTCRERLDFALQTQDKAEAAEAAMVVAEQETLALRTDAAALARDGVLYFLNCHVSVACVPRSQALSLHLLKASVYCNDLIDIACIMLEPGPADVLCAVVRACLLRSAMLLLVTQIINLYSPLRAA